MKNALWSKDRFSGSFWLHLGRWLEKKGMASVAASCFRQCASGHSRSASEASFKLSQQLLVAERYGEAIKLCTQALERDPVEARLWCALGAAQRRLAQMDAARASYEKAVALLPTYAQAWSNLGEWCMTKADYAAALAHFDQALKHQPGLMEAMNNRAAVLYELTRFSEAEKAARQAIDLHPQVAALHVNLGNILLHTGRARLAIKAFRQALALDPACAEAQIGLATMLGENHRLAETLAFIEHEIAVKGETNQRLVALALAQQSKGDWSAAEATCRKVLAAQPNNVSALCTLSSCLSTRSDHRGAIEAMQRALEESPQLPGVYSNIAFDATYLHDLSAAELFSFHAEWSARFEPSTTLPLPPHADRQPDRALRIGYVSGDFSAHPVGFLVRDVLAHHDSTQFYIHCYSMMRNFDNPVTVAIREQADSWIDALLMSDDELAEQIRQDRIDILVDLSGHTAYNRLLAFVQKPAPVQATWIGYFHSTGLKSIDYFITDPHTSPPPSGQLFSETPVYLPHSRFCYAPPDYAPEVAPAPVLARNAITFGSFNRVEKLVDPVVEAWSKILLSVPDSRLVLKSGPLANDSIGDSLRQRFAACGLPAERLELRAPSAHPEMLAQYGEIDIALDPFPFNGGMTTLEALWMGVPVVTLAGQNVVSRQSYSALQNLQCPELIFPDLESYIAGAIALAQDRDRLQSLRASLRPRMAASPLRQPEQFTRDLEALYRRMWRAACAGERLPAWT